MVLVQADALLRVGKQAAQRIDLLSQGVLAVACGFEFFLHRATAFRVEVGRVNLLLKCIDLVATDSSFQRVRQPHVNDLGEAAEFLLDRLGLADQSDQNAVLWPLLVDEVMTEHLIARLKLAVDPAVALFHATGVPRHVEMKQIRAMGL